MANRDLWTVTAVAGDGTVTVTAKDRRVELASAYVADAVQLAYAATDYGNQGVTVDRSITWVGPATTAGGLYVGATRGRYANQVHVVAEGPDTAHDMLAAAARRDRADRGLDAAREEVRARAIRMIDEPGTRWRSTAELERWAQAIEAGLAGQLERLVDRPVLDPAVRAAADAADRARVAEGRRRAAWHTDRAEQITAARPGLVAQARADYLAARDDARIIAAGPGRLRRRAGQVEAAEIRRAEIARRWETELPGPEWNDQAVAHAAERAVTRATNPGVNYHLAEADTAGHGAHQAEQSLARRDHVHHETVEINQANDTRRAELHAAAQTERDTLARIRALRQAIAKQMTPDQAAAADHARDTHLAQEQQRAQEQNQAQTRRRGPGAGQTLSPADRARQNALDLARRASHNRGGSQRDGPGIEM